MKYTMLCTVCTKKHPYTVCGILILKLENSIAVPDAVATDAAASAIVETYIFIIFRSSKRKNI